MLPDSEVRIQILKILYKRFREHPRSIDSEFSPKKILEILKIEPSIFEFNMIYLSEKNLIDLKTDALSQKWYHVRITINGIDLIEQIIFLEEEVKKVKPDKTKIKKLTEWIKDNYNWIIPILIDLGFKIPYPSS